MKVRYYGHVGQTTGYGKAAEAMCLSLIAAGCEIEIRPLSPFESVKVDPDLPLARCLRRDWELTQPDAVIVHTLPMSCASVIELAGLEPLEVPLVAYTTWEGSDAIPADMALGLDNFDAVWVPSGQNLLSVEAGKVMARVAVMPHAFDPKRLERKPTTTRADLDGRFHFYYVGAWTCRKNPEGIIRAFTHAFTPQHPVMLTIHSLHASEEEFALALMRTGFNQKTAPYIRFNNREAPIDHILDLHQSLGDCFVTASRGEGWNLPAFDAVIAKRKVISPMNLGSDEFLIGTTTEFVPNTRQPAGCDARIHHLEKQGYGIEVVGAHGQTSKTEWLEPDLIAMADRMRDVYVNQDRDLIIHYDIVDRFGYEAVGKKARTYLEAM